MMAKKSYDTKSGDLAEHFLQDEKTNQDDVAKLRREQLAIAIQEAVETWFSDNPSSAHDAQPLSVSRGTLRCALCALETLNAEDYHHNNGAAEGEIRSALTEG